MVQHLNKSWDRVAKSIVKIRFTKSEVLRMEVEYLGFVVGKNGTLMGLEYRQATRKFPLPKLPEVLTRFSGMAQHYKHLLKNPFRDSADLHQPKTQTFSELPD